MAGRRWSAEEDQALRDGIESRGYAAIAASVGRSVRACYLRASQLGIASVKGSDQHRARISRRLTGRRCSPRTEFKKGHVPWTKGMTGIRLSPATEFKPGCLRGQAARKYRRVGYIHVRRDKKQRRGHKPKSRKWIKVRDDGPPQRRWMPLANYLWEKAHGAVPPGHCVVHLDGDTLDAVLDNLACIPRRELPQLQRRLDAGFEKRRRAACSKATKRRWKDYRAIRDFKKQREACA